MTVDLVGDHLVAVDVRLQDAADLYVPADAAPGPGTVATQRIPAGQLLPGSALGTADRLDRKPVAVPVDGGATLRLGTVSGPYRHVPDDPAGLIHQVPVRWAGTVPRTAVVPSGAMQDVRPVFPVLIGPPSAMGAE